MGRVFETHRDALHLDAKGKYRDVRPRKGELHSTVLPGFWLRPEWL